MDMNMRSRGVAASTNRPPRLSVRPVYEDFKPLMESKEDTEAQTVYIHLPGFLKEQIKIVAESSRGLLRVRGERLIAGNTWSRFSEEIPVPANCEITETRAKFEGGVLRITMPKRIYSASPQSSSPAALSDEATTPEISPLVPARPAPLPPPAPARPVAPPPPWPPAATRPAAPQKTPAPAARPEAPPPPRTPARTEALPLPRRPAAAPRPDFLPPQRTSAAMPSQEALPPPRTQPALPGTRTPEPRYKQSAPQPPRPIPQAPLPQPEAARYTPSIHPKPREHEKSQFEDHQKPSLPLPPAAKYSPPGLLQSLPQPDPVPRKDLMDRWSAESNIPAPPDRWRDESNIPAPPKYPIASDRWRDESNIPTPRKDPIASDRWMTASNIPAPSKDPIASDRWRTESNIPMPPKAPVTTAAQTAEASKRHELLTEEEEHREGKRSTSLRGLKEDRQLVVNMGVAVMVIVALGAWISYSFGSSANPSN